MIEQAPAVKAFNEYAQRRIWHYARNTEHGIVANQTTLGMFMDFFIAGAVWEQECQAKTRKAKGAAKRKKA